MITDYHKFPLDLCSIHLNSNKTNIYKHLKTHDTKKVNITVYNLFLME